MDPLKDSAAAAAIFLVLYLLVFILMCWMYATKRLEWRSRYFILFFHIIFRVVAQAIGLAFAFIGFTDSGIGLLIAYIVLGAEGYFTLCLCAFQFLISLHHMMWGESGLEPLLPPGLSRKERHKLMQKSRMRAIDTFILLPANILIIVGGSLMQAHSADYDFFVPTFNQQTGEILRAVGLGLFLAVIQYYAVELWLTFRDKRTPRPYPRVLWLLTPLYPLLTVRGVYGILSAVDNDYNYYNPQVYTDAGLSSSFLVVEYVMGTTMEWLCCLLLLISYLYPEGKTWSQWIKTHAVPNQEQSAETSTSKDSAV
jgi:hypothetical protein